MEFAKKGDWVQIENVVLTAGSRAPAVPEDTQNCDLKLWVKGTLQSDAELGDAVTVRTAAGRFAEGVLVAVHPGYTHSYGEFQPELLRIEEQLKEIMRGGGNE